MKQNFTKYIKKLRLVKGRKYILFIPRTVMSKMNMVKLSGEIWKMGLPYKDFIVVATETNEGIKIIEK